MVASLARCEEAPSAYFRSASELGVPTVSIPCLGRIDINAAQRLSDLIKSERFDLLCCHGYKVDLVGRFSSWRTGVPIVSYLHGWTGHTPMVKMYEALDRRILRWMDGVIAVSDPIRDTALAAGVSPERLTVIPNGIRIEEFTPRDTSDEVRCELGIGREGPIIGAIGRLSREKGQRYLLQALSIILKENKCAWVVLVGDGPDRAALEEQAREAGLISWVRFTGFRQDIRRLVCAFDVFALPSLTEGTPLSLLEAMSCLRPSVATAVGGVPQIIRDGKTGYLVPSKDPVALANAILDALSNSEEAHRRADAGAKWVRERYSLDRQVRDLTGVYQAIVNRRISATVHPRRPKSLRS